MKIVDWYELGFKHWVRESGYDDRVLHLAAGVLILFAMALVLRRPLSCSWMILVVACGAAGNEVMDFLFYGSWRWSDTTGDVINTMSLPLIIFGCATLWSVFARSMISAAASRRQTRLATETR